MMKYGHLAGAEVTSLLALNPDFARDVYHWEVARYYRLSAASWKTRKEAGGLKSGWRRSCRCRSGEIENGYRI